MIFSFKNHIHIAIIKKLYFVNFWSAYDSHTHLNILHVSNIMNSSIFIVPLPLATRNLLGIAQVTLHHSKYFRCKIIFRQIKSNVWYFEVEYVSWDTKKPVNKYVNRDTEIGIPFPMLKMNFVVYRKKNKIILSTRYVMHKYVDICAFIFFSFFPFSILILWWCRQHAHWNIIINSNRVDFLVDEMNIMACRWRML